MKTTDGGAHLPGLRVVGARSGDGGEVPEAGVVKSDGTALLHAVPGVDYVYPLGIAGGQAIHGGTAQPDRLSLYPNANTAVYTGSVDVYRKLRVVGTHGTLVVTTYPTIPDPYGLADLEIYAESTPALELIEVSSQNALHIEHANGHYSFADRVGSAPSQTFDVGLRSDARHGHICFESIDFFVGSIGAVQVGRHGSVRGYDVPVIPGLNSPRMKTSKLQVYGNATQGTIAAVPTSNTSDRTPTMEYPVRMGAVAADGSCFFSANWEPTYGADRSDLPSLVLTLDPVTDTMTFKRGAAGVSVLSDIWSIAAGTPPAGGGADADLITAASADLTNAASIDITGLAATGYTIDIQGRWDYGVAGTFDFAFQTNTLAFDHELVFIKTDQGGTVAGNGTGVATSINVGVGSNPGGSGVNFRLVLSLNSVVPAGQTYQHINFTLSAYEDANGGFVHTTGTIFRTNATFAPLTSISIIPTVAISKVRYSVRRNQLVSA